MTRRRLVTQLRGELAEARTRTLVLEVTLAAERRAHKAEVDGLAVRAARAEAKAVGMHAMCPDRATCTANTDAAAKWRHEHPAYGGGLGATP